MKWLKRWLFPYYLRFVTDLSIRISAQLLGQVEQAATLAGPELADPVRSQTWYPVLAQTVLAAETQKHSGKEKREAVVKIMRAWFEKRNLQAPPLRTLHLAIETALAGPKKG